ncbi:hypothetical protein M0813_28659 [Anaeramoeba flamelloides]|uniref:Uncharacterized protein n=1 Tax=Anaeramoeba flamelloides TaxID=1746091 RepID=A0ABQ8XRY0_9EUKA|nr:hypothetical protein M0813_28659 [Anaeramoeba flamelloides]
MLQKNCNRIMNLHLFAHHFEESIKKNGGMNSLFFALEKYHQWYKPKYGKLHKNQEDTILYYSKIERRKKFIQYFKIFNNKNKKKIIKFHLKKWKEIDEELISFDDFKFKFETRSLTINKHKYLIKQDVQLKNNKIAKIKKILAISNEQNSKIQVAIKFYQNIPQKINQFYLQ